MEKYSQNQLQTKGQLPVAFFRVAILLNLLSATVACDLCATCICGSKDAFCVSRTLGEPVADSNDVETLYIKNSNLTDDFLTASNIHLVRKLHIIDCPLANVSKHMFTQLHKLELLEISRTQLEQLWPKALIRNSRLQHVDLSSNRLIDLPVGLFSRLVHLSTVILRKNRLTGVRNHTFAYNRKLHHLDLSGNLIGLVEPGALHVSEVGVPSGPAGTVNISNNLLREILDDTFLQCPDVTVLDLSANRIAFLFPRAFDGLARLTHLYLQNNSLQHLAPQVFSPLASLQVLDLSDNALVDLPPRGFSCPHLRRLLLSRNRLLRVRADALSGLPALRELFLDGNYLTALGAAFSSPTTPLPLLALLDVAGNAVTCLPKDALRGCPALERLDLSGNGLTRVQNGAFAGNVELKRLDLSGNGLRRLECASFYNLSALQELDLRGNPLQELLSEDFAHLGRLKDLQLSLDENAPCECSVFADLRERGVRMRLKYSTLSEECSAYYKQYMSEGSMDCAAKDEGENECQWRYESATSVQCDGSRLSVNMLVMLVIVLALRA